jgi:hypothetical protein
MGVELMGELAVTSLVLTGVDALAMEIRGCMRVFDWLLCAELEIEEMFLLFYILTAIYL